VGGRRGGVRLGDARRERLLVRLQRWCVLLTLVPYITAFAW
jgi:hypothetical protein